MRPLKIKFARTPVVFAAVFVVFSIVLSLASPKLHVAFTGGSGPYRWRNDNGSETTATFAAAEGTPLAVGQNTPMRLRVAAGNDGTTSDFSRKSAGAVSDSTGVGQTTFAADLVHGYGYYMINTSPSEIIKVALNQGDAAPMSVSSLILNSGENHGVVSLIDGANGYGYFITGFPSSLVKVSLNAGDAAPTRVGATALGVNFAETSVIDTLNGYAYVVDQSVSPPHLLKVSLGAGATLPSIVANIALASGDDGITTLLLDPANGYGYATVNFGNPTHVIKISLGAGAAAPTRIGSTDFLSADEFANVGVLDTVNGYAYYSQISGGGGTAPTQIVKFSLGTGAALPTRIGSITLNSGEINAYEMEADPVNGFAYLSIPTSGGSHGIIVKISLGAGNALPARVASINYDSADGGPFQGTSTAAIDVTNGYLYSATADSSFTGHVVKISISPKVSYRLEYGLKSSTCGAISSWTQVPATATSEAWQMAASANVNDGDPTTHLGGLTDPNTSFTPGQVKTTSSDASSITLGESQFTQMEYSVEATANAAGGNNYCFRLTDAGTVTPLTGTTYPEATVIATGPYLWRNDDGSETSATQAAAPGAPLAIDKNTPKRLRVAVGNDGTVTALARLGDVRLDDTAGGYGLGGMAVDASHGYAYGVIAQTSPAKIIKLALGQNDATPTVVSSLVLNSGEDFAQSILLDPNNGYGYVITYNAVVKFVLGVGDAAPTRVGSVALGFSYLGTDAIDTMNGYLYIANDNPSPPTIVKIALGVGAAAPSIAGTLTLAAGDNSYVESVLLDGTNGYGYLMAYPTSNTGLIKIALGSGSATPTRVGRVNLALGSVDSGVIDAANGYAYFINESNYPNPSVVVKVALGAGATLPSLVGQTSLLAQEVNFRRSAAFDQVNGLLYFMNTDGAISTIVQVRTGVGDALPVRVGALAVTTGTDASGVRLGIDPANGYLYADTFDSSYEHFVKFSDTPKASYRLEYGLKSSTCDAISSWTQVPATATSEAWQMAASANVNDGDPTTDLVGLTDLNTSFIPGQVKTTSSDASQISLGENQFTQMEYSISATNNAVDGANYCFRLTDAGTATALSTTYPEALIATSAPNTPTLSTPADNSYTSDGNVYFSWSSEAGATSYTLNVPGAFTQTIGTNSWTQVAMNTGTYTWTVTAHGPGGDSAASAPFTFTLMAPPAPSSPADGYFSSDTAQTIAWSAVTGATSYHVYVTEQGGVFGGVLNTTTTDTHVDLTGLNPGHLYTWNITTVDALSVQSNYSTDSSFTILGAPGISYPPDGTYMSNRSLSLTWIGFTGATGYHIFVTSNGGSTGDILDETTAATTVDLLNLAPGAYEWHVTSIDGLGHETAPSASTTFTILAPPTLSSPNDGATLTDAAPTLSWNAVTGATSYHVTVTSQGGTTGDTFDNSSVDPSVDLVGLANGTYDWFVTTEDGGANQTAPSATRSFTINAVGGGPILAAPTLSAPADNFTTSQTSVNFSWSSVSGADHYNIDAPGLLSSGPSGTSFTQDNIPPGTYAWSVAAVNSQGTPGTSSATRHFTVLAPPTLAAPVNGSTLGTNAPNLSWGAVSGATRYHVFVTTHGGVPGAVHNATTTGTSVQLSGLANGQYDWYVTTVDGASVETAPSATRTFTVLVSSGSVGGSSPAGNPTATAPVIKPSGNNNGNTPPPNPVQAGTTDATFHFTNPGNANTFNLYDAPPNSSPHLVATENDPNATSITETGLKPNTTYGDRVITAVAYGTESSPSPAFPVFTTLLPLPVSITPVYDPVAHTISLTVTGTFPNLTSGQSGIDFVIKDSSGKTLFDSGFVKTPSTGSLASVNFEPGASYTVTVTTKNIVGDLNGPKDYPITIPSSNFGAAKIVLTKTAEKTDLAVVDTRTKVTTSVTKEIKYRVTAANTGSGTANNFVLTDPLPVGLNFKAGSLIATTDLEDPEGTVNVKYDPQTRIVTASVAQLKPHESFAISFIVTPVSGTMGSVKNKASASWEE